MGVFVSVASLTDTGSAQVRFLPCVPLRLLVKHAIYCLSVWSYECGWRPAGGVLLESEGFVVATVVFQMQLTHLQRGGTDVLRSQHALEWVALAHGTLRNSAVCQHPVKNALLMKEVLAMQLAHLHVLQHTTLLILLEADCTDGISDLKH